MTGPEIAFITDEPGSNGFARKARGLGRAFEAIGRRFDAVYVKHPPDGGLIAADGGDARGAGAGREEGLVREIGLGASRAALATPALVRYLRRARPPLAIVNSGQLGPAAVLAGLIARSPVVPWEPAFIDRDLASLPSRMRAMDRAQTLLYRRAPAILGPSADMVAWIAEHRGIDPARTHLVANPIDGDEVRAAGGGEGPDPEGPFKLCAVGRLVEQKGYDVMIDGLARVRDELPRPWRLTIVGEAGIWRGSWGERIRAQVRGLGLEGSVELAGYLDNPHAVMRRSHLFVHAARWEPFGNVLVEALALGVPVIATDCPGGPREILDGGRYGRLVANEDPVAFGRAVAALAADEDARHALGVAGPRRADDYSPAVIAERLRELDR